MIRIEVNGKPHDVDVEDATPLLWVLREQLGLTGTKYGCGVAQCGACTVHLDGRPTRSCVMPVVAVGAQKVTTIEGLAHPVQEAWVAGQVPQCGYCQSGQLMVAAALVDSTPSPTDADIDTAMQNLCRCATYDRIRLAIRAAAERRAAEAPVEAPGADVPAKEQP